MNLTPHSPFSSKASQLLSWGHWFTFANIGLVLLISSVYLFADKAPSTFVGWFYMLITWISHTSFITFCAFVLTIFPLSLIFPYPRHIRGMAAIIASVGIVVLTVDAFVYLQLGYHINPASLSDIFVLLWETLVGSSLVNLIITIAMLGLVLTFELLAGNYAWRHLAELKSYKFPRYATGTIVTCFALSHSLHIWADANAFFDITKQDNVLPLSYPTTAKSLLARHDLLDIEQYEEAHSLSIGDTHSKYKAPVISAVCKEKKDTTEQPINVYAYTDEALFQKTATALQSNVKNNVFRIDSVLRAGKSSDALFSLIYGLPSYYKESVLLQQQVPVWSINNDLMSVNTNGEFSFVPSHQASKLTIIEVSDEIDIDSSKPFVAIDISAQQATVLTSSAVTNIELFAQASGLVQPNDITYTLLSSYLGCAPLAQQSMLASNIKTRSHAEGVNFTQGVLVAFKKDKITLVNQDGSFKQMSAKEGFVLNGSLDIPFLIQSIKTLKKFTAPEAQ
ncbi:MULTISPECIES: DUF3413 domain-containing protein [Pseudoalteromonas]|uniref:DUF3413 domain-containing protein n=1 Tax=Pseudoalteromonas TaxID=53246 RepID=UPI00273968A2|nr:DUF3413 domain-containing protein [Pseudoalteromonas piscicida]MDP4487424.1 DUF3413 domain-containing protein [Pseudoalteromonas piscicida]